ncbi:hypothetical protein D3C83_282530 [compost metagenome]
MSMRISLLAGVGAPLELCAGNFTHSIGTSNEFSFQMLLSPVSEPSGCPLKEMLSTSGG